MCVCEGCGEERKMKVRWWWKREKDLQQPGSFDTFWLALTSIELDFVLFNAVKPFLLWGGEGGERKERMKERKTESKGKGLLTSILENGSKVRVLFLSLLSWNPQKRQAPMNWNWMRGRKGGGLVGWLGGRKLGSWGSWGSWEKEGKKEEVLCGEKYISFYLFLILLILRAEIYNFFQGKNGAIANYQITNYSKLLVGPIVHLQKVQVQLNSVLPSQFNLNKRQKGKQRKKKLHEWMNEKKPAHFARHSESISFGPFLLGAALHTT